MLYAVPFEISRFFKIFERARVLSREGGLCPFMS